MKNIHENIRASLLDRLMDDEPAVTREPAHYRMVSLGQIKVSVARDLENLLNTKNFFSHLPLENDYLNGSLFVYGLPDFTSFNLRSPQVKLRLLKELEKAITRFEPRLRDVKMTIEESRENERSLRFKITAVLIIDPVTEPVTFDTIFDINRCEYRIPC